MKLLYAPASPFARKVRAAAIELQLDDRITLEYTEVVPGRPNRAYRESVNPLRKIPALVTDDGRVLYDSTVICEFLDGLAGGGRLIPAPDSGDRWRVLTNHALAQGMCEAAILIRYETWLRPESLRWRDWIDDQWDKIWSGLAWFEVHRDQLAPPLDISHLALGCLLGYIDFRFPDNGWDKRYPHVRAWYAELSRRPSFAKTPPQAQATRS
jgi:glutathione S-transferase